MVVMILLKRILENLENAFQLEVIIHEEKKTLWESSIYPQLTMQSFPHTVSRRVVLDFFQMFEEHPNGHLSLSPSGVGFD